MVSIGSKLNGINVEIDSGFGWLLKYDDCPFILLQIHFYFCLK
jgi:hypothetical protein